MKVNSYRDLKVWQVGMETAAMVYKLTEKFPKQEAYGLTSQVQRAAVSIPSNIAEGHARDSTKEYLRALSIARGSLAELETQLLLSESLGYLTNVDLESVLSKAAEIGKMLNALQQSLKTTLAPSP